MSLVPWGPPSVTSWRLVHQQTVSSLENDPQRCTIASLYRLMTALGALLQGVSLHQHGGHAGAHRRLELGISDKAFEVKGNGVVDIFCTVCSKALITARIFTPMHRTLVTSTVG